MVELKNDFFTTKELAGYLNVSVKFIIKHRNDGTIPGVVRVGRSWRFRRSEVEKRILNGVFLVNK
jgi:excisionase family DNA binding protein